MGYLWASGITGTLSVFLFLALIVGGVNGHDITKGNVLTVFAISTFLSIMCWGHYIKYLHFEGVVTDIEEVEATTAEQPASV